MKDIKPWILKHTPSSATEVQGQDSIIEQIRSYIKSYTKKKRRGQGKPS